MQRQNDLMVIQEIETMEYFNQNSLT